MTQHNETRGALTFRKKPVVVEAEPYNGPFSVDEMLERWGESFAAASSYKGGFLTIATLEGTHHASIGDWVIRGVKGEFYFCKPDIFAQTYEPADSSLPAGDGLTDWRAQMEALIDIYDDAYNNSPESRCYVDGAFAEHLAEVRALLKAAPRQPGEMDAGVQEVKPIKCLGCGETKNLDLPWKYSSAATCKECGCVWIPFACGQGDQSAKFTAASAQQDEREAFEAWIDARPGRLRKCVDREGDSPLGKLMWEAWQARATQQVQADARFFVDHGLWHDRLTGQHMYTQDQYDELRRNAFHNGYASRNEEIELAKHKEECVDKDCQGCSEQVQADAGALVAGHFVKRSKFGPWIEVDPTKECGTPFFTHPAGGSEESAMVLDLLLNGGFINSDKLEQARRIARAAMSREQSGGQ